MTLHFKALKFLNQSSGKKVYMQKFPIEYPGAHCNQVRALALHNVFADNIYESAPIGRQDFFDFLLVLIAFHFIGPPGISIIGMVHFEHLIIVFDFRDILGIRFFDFLQSHKNDLTV
jgi:hypothetical protein